MLTYPNPKWTFQPEHGFSLNEAMINDTGSFLCIGTMNNISTVKNFTISVKGFNIERKESCCLNFKFKTQIGIELERMGAPDDPVEGSNVTLICRVIFPEVKYAAPPEWAYQVNNNARMQVIDETNLPEGLEKFNHNINGLKLNCFSVLFRHSDRDRRRKEKSQYEWIQTELLRKSIGSL